MEGLRTYILNFPRLVLYLNTMYYIAMMVTSERRLAWCSASEH